jgi:hypothetical protein
MTEISKKGAHWGNFEAEGKGGRKAARIGTRRRSGAAEGSANMVSPVLNSAEYPVSFSLG